MVSIIIPTHNRLTMLKRAIRSVKDQTFKQYDLIVQTDGSTDGTNDYLKSIEHTNFKFFVKSLIFLKYFNSFNLFLRNFLKL